MIYARSRLSSCSSVLLAAVSLALSVSAPAGSATMGFTRQFYFPAAAGTNLHWIALPWRYQPQDVGTAGILDAEDLCQDLGGEETIAAVVRWNEPSSTLVEHPCGGENPFPVSQGVGYALRNATGQTIQGAVAGAHDNVFSYSLAPSGGSQLSWLSVPYHLRIPENEGDLRVTAEDLCRQIGSSEVLAIIRWDEVSATYKAHGCGSAFQPPFEIVRGKAYGVINRVGQTIEWQPIHY